MSSPVAGLSQELCGVIVLDELKLRELFGPLARDLNVKVPVELLKAPKLGEVGARSPQARDVEVSPNGFGADPKIAEALRDSYYNDSAWVPLR